MRARARIVAEMTKRTELKGRKRPLEYWVEGPRGTWRARVVTDMAKKVTKADVHRAWEKRSQLYSEGIKLRDEGAKLRDEGDKLLRASGYMLCAEGYKLCAESESVFLTAVLDHYGDVPITETATGCIIEGDEYKTP
jgi:hypothetical protein